jgi:hypothetical protein
MTRFLNQVDSRNKPQVNTLVAQKKTTGHFAPPTRAQVLCPQPLTLTDTDARYRYRLTQIVLAHTVGSPPKRIAYYCANQPFYVCF